MEDVQAVLEKAFEQTKEGQGISREKIKEFRAMI